MEQILEHPDEKEVGFVVLFDNGSATSDSGLRTMCAVGVVYPREDEPTALVKGLV
jgi:hypothetical protein